VTSQTEQQTFSLFVVKFVQKRFAALFVTPVSAKKQKMSKPITAAKRAGLNLEPARAKAILKRVKPDGMKLADNTRVALAAALEYAIAEVLELAIAHAKQQGRKRVTQRDIVIGFQNDEELNKLVGNATVIGGGYTAKYNREAAARREKKRRKRQPKDDEDDE